jgi:hypothetical protein
MDILQPGPLNAHSQHSSFAAYQITPVLFLMPNYIMTNVMISAAPSPNEYIATPRKRVSA